MENRTSVDNVLVMEIVHGLQNLFDRLRGILLSELALVANPIEQLPTSSKLSDDVEFVLQEGVSGCEIQLPSGCMRTLDSNQSWNLTM